MQKLQERDEEIERLDHLMASQIKFEEKNVKDLIVSERR